MADCIFCSIVAGDIPAEVVREDEHTVAFRDLDPQAPTHVLVIPRRHVPDVGSLAVEAPELFLAPLRAARPGRRSSPKSSSTSARTASAPSR